MSVVFAERKDTIRLISAAIKRDSITYEEAYPMETILIEAFKFIAGSAAGGITWDIIKEAGNRLLAGFKKHFVNAEYFNDESQAEGFLRDISSKESLNKRRPLEDVWSVYDTCTGKEASDLFKTEFIDWIKANEEAIKRLGERADQENKNFIQIQVNRGKAQVTNIGTQYNFGGIGGKSERPDK